MAGGNQSRIKRTTCSVSQEMQVVREIVTLYCIAELVVSIVGERKTQRKGEKDLRRRVTGRKNLLAR